MYLSSPEIEDEAMHGATLDLLPPGEYAFDSLQCSAGMMPQCASPSCAGNAGSHRTW